MIERHHATVRTNRWHSDCEPRPSTTAELRPATDPRTRGPIERGERTLTERQVVDRG